MHDHYEKWNTGSSYNYGVNLPPQHNGCHPNTAISLSHEGLVYITSSIYTCYKKFVSPSYNQKHTSSPSPPYMHPYTHGPRATTSLQITVVHLKDEARHGSHFMVPFSATFRAFSTSLQFLPSQPSLRGNHCRHICSKGH
jgi:hypothetical protein